jgi:6-phosphogluconate dehydrogenase
MMHNGIEYADMQLIAEAYGLMSNGLGMAAAEIGAVFQAWNKGPLNSYLIEIAGKVALATDPKTGKAMLDVILDKAGQKGTGRWSVIEALHLGAPASMMAAAVEARNISADLETRLQMQAVFGPSPMQITTDKTAAIAALEQAMIAAKVCAYAQGFEVLSRASDSFNWNLDLAAIARVWRAGCIIRSVFLNEISDVFDNSDEKHLLLAPAFQTYMKTNAPALQDTVVTGLSNGHAIPALSAALNYHNMRRTARSTANMIQGLRDFFGAHTFERIDNPGVKVNGPWHD